MQLTNICTVSLFIYVMNIYFAKEGLKCTFFLTMFALGNELTLVTCKSYSLKDLHATSVLSFPNANKKRVFQSLYLC